MKKLVIHYIRKFYMGIYIDKHRLIGKYPIIKKKVIYIDKNHSRRVLSIWLSHLNIPKTINID